QKERHHADRFRAGRGEKVRQDASRGDLRGLSHAVPAYYDDYHVRAAGRITHVVRIWLGRRGSPAAGAGRGWRSDLVAVDDALSDARRLHLSVGDHGEMEKEETGPLSPGRPVAGCRTMIGA